MSLSAEEPAPVPSLPPLQLFQPSDHPATLSSDLTLSEVYRLAYMPIIEVGRGNSADTRSQNATSIALWVKHTGDPPLNQLNQITCSHFASQLINEPKIESNTTINKHCAAVQKVLSFCGPPMGRNFRNLGIIDRVPYIERPPKEQMRIDEPFTLDELDTLAVNTAWFAKPNRLSVAPAIYWCALFLLLYATGLRIKEAILLEWRDDEGTSLRIRSRIRKGGRKKHLVSVNSTARMALDWMQGVDEVRIFPWPNSWASKSSFFKVFRAYRKKFLARHRWDIACHGFRRLHNVELLKINERACAAALGHGAKVNAEAYVGRDVVKAAVEKLPTPNFQPDPQRQLSFE